VTFVAEGVAAYFVIAVTSLVGVGLSVGL